MRIFGAESMNNILQKLGLKDGESIDHPWINKALERAQQKVEARNFDIRKTLLKFDNVLNDQRHVIFSQRNNLINKNEIFKYSDNFLDEISNNLKDDKNKYLVNPKDSELNTKLRSILGKSFDDKEIDKLIKLNDKDFISKIHDKFDQKRKERIEYLGEDRVQEIEKRIFLQTIDLNWKLHIQYLEQLRQVIGLRSYGQRDPLTEYKKEAFTLFKNLLEKLKTDLITILINLTIIQKKNEEKDTVNKTKKINISNNPNCLLFKKKGEKISRNDRCEATGKKFKQCCGAL
jgi:preprotein translocase subunit SecA